MELMWRRGEEKGRCTQPGRGAWYINKIPMRWVHLMVQNLESDMNEMERET